MGLRGFPVESKHKPEFSTVFGGQTALWPSTASALGTLPSDDSSMSEPLSESPLTSAPVSFPSLMSLPLSVLFLTLFETTEFFGAFVTA